MTLIPKEVPYWILRLFDILQTIVDNIENIQVNDDATTTRTANVSEVKDWTGLKCTFTGAHSSQRKYLRMMKKLTISKLIFSFCLINMINHIHKRQQYTELLME
jgi:hypothetical protein